MFRRISSRVAVRFLPDPDVAGGLQLLMYQTRDELEALVNDVDNASGDTALDALGRDANC